MTNMDPVIQAVFGPAPDGLDLTENRGPADSAAVSVLLVLAVCAVLARFICRFYARNAFLADDWAILVTLAFVAGAAGLTIAGKLFFPFQCKQATKSFVQISNLSSNSKQLQLFQYRCL